jgi:hypothetical protein
MTRFQPDTSMDGLPMRTVIDPTPTERPLHDRTVNQGPTTLNGILSQQPDSLNQRFITAQFATPAEADSARQALIARGIPAAAITIIPHAAESPAVHGDTKPADDTLLGRIREAILPDEASAGSRAAIAADAAILNVEPTADQVETVVQTLAAARPLRFDADLERWRNKG